MGNDDDSRGPRCPYRSDDHDKTPATEQHTHPLIAWKHFVDNQFSAITRLAFPNSRRAKQVIVVAEQALVTDRQAHFRWTGRDTTEDHDDMIVQRLSSYEVNAARDATKMLLKEAVKRSSDVSTDKILELYKDDEALIDAELDPLRVPRLSLGGACYYMSETDDNLPSTAGWVTRSASTPRWLSVDWFKQSRYSPVHTERLPGLEHSRDAFEDLLMETLERRRSACSDVGIRPNYPSHLQSWSHGPGLDWMLSLYCRGILPLSPELTSAVNFGADMLDSPPDLGRVLSPGSVWHQYADLIRAVISPPASGLSETTASLEAARAIPDSATASLGGAESTTESMTAKAVSFWDFMSTYRDFDSVSTQTDDLWRAVYEENADKAASIIVRWEGQGRDARDLIDAEDVIDEYLFMDTHPELWPLCEALEKAHSDLLFEQAWMLKAIGRCPGIGDGSVVTALPDKADFTRPETESAKTEPHAQPHGVLAALTTTHTTRMPDGSVSTKVVLKKRFADGREETTESIKMEYPGHEQLEKAHDEPEKKQEKKGWFWS